MSVVAEPHRLLRAPPSLIGNSARAQPARRGALFVPATRQQPLTTRAEPSHQQARSPNTLRVTRAHSRPAVGGRVRPQDDDDDLGLALTPGEASVFPFVPQQRTARVVWTGERDGVAAGRRRRREDGVGISTRVDVATSLAGLLPVSRELSRTGPGCHGLGRTSTGRRPEPQGLQLRSSRQLALFGACGARFDGAHSGYNCARSTQKMGRSATGPRHLGVGRP